MCKRTGWRGLNIFLIFLFKKHLQQLDLCRVKLEKASNYQKYILRPKNKLLIESWKVMRKGFYLIVKLIGNF